MLTRAWWWKPNWRGKQGIKFSQVFLHDIAQRRQQ
jgi:hypothetical protein